MRLRWALASTAALFAASLLCAPAQAIVNGTAVTDMSTRPYQVALLGDFPGANDVQYCGGAIQDETHVVTAAHCVFGVADLASAGQPVPAGKLSILAGVPKLSQLSTAGQTTPPSAAEVRQVVAVSLDPSFDPGAFASDAAVLTLDKPLDPSSTVQDIQPITYANWAAMPLLAPLIVSGWGSTATDPYPNTLNQATVPLEPDSTCAGAYSGYNAPTMICAGNGSTDACFGDSGGPLVAHVDGVVPRDLLVGIVSYGGQTCADARFPGVYAEVANTGIAGYLGRSTHGAAPMNSSAPSLQGRVAVGSTVSCSAGSWSNSPTTFAYQFESHNGSTAVPRTSLGAHGSYVVQAADAGRTIDCIVKAGNADGFGIVKSAAVSVPVPPAPVAPTPAPTPAPAPAPKPAVPSDTTAPVARITSKRCKANRCALNILVADAGFSAGIASVQATVRSTYRATCMRKGRRVACTKHRTRKLAATALSATRFRITARLPYGRNAFAVLALDRAGHFQALPSKVTLVTRRKKR